MSRNFIATTVISMGVVLSLGLPVSFAQGYSQSTVSNSMNAKQGTVVNNRKAGKSSGNFANLSIEDLNKKLALLNESVQLNPKDDQAYLERSEVYKELNERAMRQDNYGAIDYKRKAIDDVNKAIALNPSEQNYSRGSAVYYFVRYSKNENEFKQIQKEFIDFINKGIKRYPKIGNLYFARVALEFNDHDGSLETDADTTVYHNAQLENSIHFGKPLTESQVQDYMKFLELNPPIHYDKIAITDIVFGDLIYSYRRGVKGIDLSKLSQILDRLIDNHPEVVWLRLRRININSMLNIQGNILRDYEKLVELDPTNADAYYAKMGDVYYNQKNCEKAIECYTKSLNSAEYPDVYNSRGNAYSIIGKSDNAKKDFQRAIELDSGNIK